MAKQKLPSTGALRALRNANIPFEAHRYSYEPRGGAMASARELKVDLHAVIKTLIMQDDTGKPLVVLMHGDKEVSTRSLARHLGVKSLAPCKPEIAQKHSGYQVGGTSPFGTRKKMPVYVEESIFELPEIYINGGQRGLLVSITPQVIDQLLDAESVSIAREASGH